MCYEAWIFEREFIPREELSLWEEKSRRLSDSMREAGLRSARKKLAALQKEWNESFLGFLSKCAQRKPESCLLGACAEKLTHALEGTEGALPLAWETGDNYARVLLELTEPADLEDLTAQWQRALPEVNWAPSAFFRAVSKREALEWMEDLRESTASPASLGLCAAQSPKAFCHLTVLLHEAVEAMRPSEGKVIIDATLGGGGHSESLLEQGAVVWGIDQDPEALAAASLRLTRFGSRFHMLRGNFRALPQLLQKQGIDVVDGILADIGVSSHQLGTAERGFSFREDGPLDMRMDPQTPRSAADLVNEADEAQLAEWLWKYGEEKASRTIARAIVRAREQAPITTTSRLARVIEGVLPRRGKLHPATRSFQALRIVVNDELNALQEFLHGGVALLREGGRLAVITFHSLEDRLVKHFFDRVTRPEIDRPEWPASRPNPDCCARLVWRKPIVAGADELAANPRARSAKLRVLEKLAAHA